MFPKGHKRLSVWQSIVIICLIRIVDGDHRIASVGLFHPLHKITRIGKNFLTSLAHSRRRFLVIGIARVARTESMIVIKEIDRAETTVLAHLTHHTPYAVAVVRIILAVQGYAIVAQCKEDTALGNIPSHTLVHNSPQRLSPITAVGILQCGIGCVVFMVILWYIIRGK